VDDLPEKPVGKDQDKNKGKKQKSKASSSNSNSGMSRRHFLKISGASAAVPMAGPLVAAAGALAAQTQESAVQGPGKVPVTLNINGKNMNAQLEPRVTLLDALRDQFELTGAKRVCDRGTCGACTVHLDGKAVYACSILAIDAQGRQITTIESLSENGKLHPVQQAFVDNDGQQCGFCTPGFVMACKAFLDQHPKPTLDEIKHGVSGNFCRCGTYAGIRAALMQASGQTKGA
jgi:xanthine dehydrogenase YagT iron-sulfur-binding subunit